MSEEYERKDVSWSSVSETFPEPITIAAGQEVAFTVKGLPPAVTAVTLYDAASGEVFGALARDDDGEMVRVDPTDAVIGAVLSPDGSRWLRRADVEDDTP